MSFALRFIVGLLVLVPRTVGPIRVESYLFRVLHVWMAPRGSFNAAAFSV